MHKRSEKLIRRIIYTIDLPTDYTVLEATLRAVHNNFQDHFGHPPVITAPKKSVSVHVEDNKLILSFDAGEETAADTIKEDKPLEIKLKDDVIDDRISPDSADPADTTMRIPRVRQK